MTDMYDFADLIQHKRKLMGISQRQVAFKVGIQPTYLSKIERREFNAPSEQIIKALSEVLKLDFCKLMALAGKIPQDVVDYLTEDRTGNRIRLIYD